MSVHLNWGERPNIPALEEFLFHSVKYAFPAERGEPTRGVLTAYAGPPLNKLIVMGDELPPVWPYPEGESKGVSFDGTLTETDAGRFGICLSADTRRGC